MRSWILPDGIPGEGRVKPLQLKCRNAAYNLDVFTSAIDDQYGIGEAEIWYKGHYDVITKSNENIRLDAKGERFKGRFVFMAPSWGRWAGKRLWVLRIYDR